MDLKFRKMLERFAETVLFNLDVWSKNQHIPRAELVGIFIDALNALEQNKEQE